MIACRQEPNSEGIRKTRWAIIRNTYRELTDTTMESFFDWFPKELGLWRAMDMKWTLTRPLGDGTILEAEFIFRALDKPDDIKKLLSLEITGGWINEAREVPKAVVDMLMGRVGRYPSAREGGATWHGIILDTNPPDSDHWMYKLFEENCPDNHAIFHQPSGLSPEAENISNLPKNYYGNMQAGKDQEWINVYVHGHYGFVQDGKPIYSEYKDDVHHTDQPILLDTSRPIYIGIDFGLTPAAVLAQESASGRWLLIDELVTEDMGALTFGRLLREKLNREYAGFEFEIYGDPAGEQRAQSDETTPFQILHAQGITASPAYTNDFVLRREAVASTLTRMDFSGNTGFVLGPKCKILRKAMAGGYRYKRMQVTGQDKYQDKPEKNRYSHVAEALQYLMIGAGVGGKVIETKGWGNSPNYSNFDRMVV